MKILSILSMTILAFLSSEGKAQALELKTQGTVQIYDNNGYVNEELEAQRPSCQMVKHRLQEYFKRANEAEDFLDWYHPEKMDSRQSRALLNLMRRTPFFSSDRLYKNVRVFFQWEIPRESFTLLSQYTILPKQLFRDVEIWNDPFQGYLPEEFTFEIYDRQHVMAQMSMRMTYEAFCLETTETRLRIQTKDIAVNFTGIHNPDEL